MASTSDRPFDIVRAETAAQFDTARALFREYAATLETGICLAGFERELTVLPQMYGAPDGALLLALPRSGEEALGCAGIRRLDTRRAELKRVYVREAARGLGAGRALTVAALDQARSLGYANLVLDTLESMTVAQALYRSLGFRECAAFHAGNTADAQADGLRYFECVL